MNIDKNKLLSLLKQMKAQFDFDVEVVLDAIMKAAPARNIVTKEQLAELVAMEIDSQMNQKAMAVAQTEAFEDPHQEAGAIAIAIGNANKGKELSRVEIIKMAFMELMKNEELILMIEDQGLLMNKDISLRR